MGLRGVLWNPTEEKKDNIEFPTPSSCSLSTHLHLMVGEIGLLESTVEMYQIQLILKEQVLDQTLKCTYLHFVTCAVHD